jgi:hypothetical protein
VSDFIRKLILKGEKREYMCVCVRKNVIVFRVCVCVFVCVPCVWLDD